MSGRRLALFDIDCTLIDADGAGGRAIRRALDEVYGRWRQADDYTYHGRTDPQIVRDLTRAAGVPDDEIEAKLEDCLDHYVRALRGEVRAGSVTTLPGVRELITALDADADVLVGLVTGNIIGGAGVKLGPTGLAGRFRVGAYGSDSAVRDDLPGIAVRRAEELTSVRYTGKEIVVVGDTPADVTCGASLGVKTVAVATGRHTVDGLTKYDPDHVFADLSDWEAVRAAIRA